MPEFSALDSGLYSPSFADVNVAALFTDAEHIRFMLLVEAALARVQARLGLIGAAAASEIDAAATQLEVNFDQMRAGIANDGFPVIELVRQLRNAVSQEAGDAVHFAATTQDILDTAFVLQARAALKIMVAKLERIIAELAAMADAHRSTIMAGRTHSQQALPISFGFKVCTWLAPLLRHHQRWQQLEPRVMVLQFGGAVGTLAALKNAGLEVQSALAQELGLHLPIMPWHSQRDNMAELAAWLSLLSASLGKLAQDVLLLAQTEIGEIRESNDPARGGSSTMPQKSNPIISERILSAARMNNHLLAAVHSTMLVEHERGTHAMQLEWLTLAQMLGLTSGALENSLKLIQNMVVDQQRMLENVERSKGLMLAEALSFELAPVIGKSQAKKTTAALVQQAILEKRHLIELARATIQQKINWDTLNERHYLGSSEAMIDQVLNQAQTIKPIKQEEST